MVLFGVAACGSVVDQSASGERQQQGQTPSNTASRGTSSSLDQELPSSSIESLGLRRHDAVTVHGPSEVTATNSPVSVSVQVEVPDAVLRPGYPGTPPATPIGVDLDFTGTCLLTGEAHPRSLAVTARPTPSAPPTSAASMWAETMVLAAVPEQVEMCYVTTDAWVSGLTYTGGQLVTTISR